MSEQSPSKQLPNYLPSANEQQLFQVAYDARVPLMITGPTGCGKTRLVEHMAGVVSRPLITITCHDDLTSADLLGRFLVKSGDVEWIDGPLTRAVREGAICYLDEIVEARRDTLAALHALTDHRRTLYLDRTGETIEAPDAFMLVCSYNPTSRSVLKELKPSFRQRFVGVDLDYLAPDKEVEVLCSETETSRQVAENLVQLASGLRAASEGSTHEPPSTRSLVTAAKLVAAGLSEAQAVEAAVMAPLVTGGPLDEGLREILAATAARSEA